jgi:hypothetical protein
MMNRHAAESHLLALRLALGALSRAPDFFTDF